MSDLGRIDGVGRDGLTAVGPADTGGFPTGRHGAGDEGGDMERVGDEIARLSAHVSAALYRVLELIRVFDEGGGWHEQGFRSCAAWLGWKTGIGPGAARERVRVARALGALPTLRAAMAAGELSYSVARALTRVATPENEAGLVEAARHGTAAEMERLVRAWRQADRSEATLRAEEAERHAARELWLVCDETDGSWVVRGRLDPEAGALLQRAIEAAGEALYRAEAGRDGGDVPVETSAQARRADALGLVAEAALGEGLCSTVGDGAAETEADAPPITTAADRFQVTVHVSAETLARIPATGGAAATGEAAETGEAEPGEAGARPPEPPHLEHGPALCPDTARRLACDASVVTMVHDREGRVLDVVRKRRTVPAALRRALAHRDRRCTFPGCRCRHCDRHHVVAWAEGGETTLENLVLLCRRHHRLVHEDGWSVQMVSGPGDGPPGPRFRRPDGRPLARVPERPSVPAEPIRALERAHRARGLRIDHETATPLWDGVPTDTDWALGALRGDGWPEGEDVSAGTSSGRDGHR